jgi:hypothetical protein
MSKDINHGWFTRGTITFVGENERKDGKGSYLTVYIRFGTDKQAVTKAKVWAANYKAVGDGEFALADSGGGWGKAEVGTTVNAWGTLSTYKVDGNERVGFVIELTEGLEAFVSEDAEA